MFKYEFIRNAFIAGFFVSIICPFIGNFIVLKRYSYISDTLSHASFAGVALSYVLGINSLLVSIVYTIACAILIEYLRKYYKNFSEISLSILLTLSLGIAIIISSSSLVKINIESIIFGSILTLNRNDLIFIICTSLIVLITLILNYKKFVLMILDEDFYKVSKFNTSFYNVLFSVLLSLTISASIKVIGLLVVSSIMIIPVAASFRFKKGFSQTVLISIILGIICILLGLFLSYHLNTAPGGTIALTSIIILIICLIITKNKN
ncbi:metal ABC transporter permease [Candidatus Arthromitus sp. SFB-rat-Yit]|uniref:metal ABC transporter permease n=1 Tax=Candidatus Arthromitus sp. SFB-rat-Yit TaxID=1041504 RepID=UPI000227A264|nr:metal ABC transporter permease [Candidatus Arthromitus sp. SFB-rat-Yit]BAK80786.1 hydrophobic membrane protein ZurM [Candidatus Arthromitus sp. SFB-rat-Yit]